MTPVAATRPALQVEGLTVHFGGLVAVDGLSFTAEQGSITALIGPNGAGKTTTFNACCGLVRGQAGRVVLDGADITGLPAAARARCGLGRTFQVIELYDSLTVAENVQLGREPALAGSNPWRQLVRPRRDRDDLRTATEAALELCGLGDLRRRRAGELTTGQRRLVELARAAAGRFSVLLLDEPTSGLDPGETDRLAAIVARIAGEGQTILLVEHDMRVVMALSDHVYVLDFGRLIFEGTPDAVRASDIVRAAYLGTEFAADTVTC
jgi:ABC-type branched-subunit amino acid transport system ATPase component